jgi:radical SAM protein with 4Fe4S-binding SPASM domain
MPEPEKIERLLDHPAVQRLLRWMTCQDPDGRSWLGRFFEAYADPGGPAPLGTFRGRPLWRRPEFALPWLLTEYVRRKTGSSRDTFRRRVFGNPATRRGLVATVRSVGRLGLTQPQRFVAPLMVVWNFTQACNMACKHCYQDAGVRVLSRRSPKDEAGQDAGPRADLSRRSPDSSGRSPDGDLSRRSPDLSGRSPELSFDEQKRIVDLLARRDVAMIAFSGGEPLMSPTFLPIARYAADRGMHLTVATNGTLLAPDKVAEMVAAGIRYAEISLDSTDPAKHDAWRGSPGFWDRAVAGIRNVVRAPGIKCGVAMTVTRWNLADLRPMLEWCIAEGVDTFYAFNFIPTGRARDVADQDLSPAERETMLATLQEYLADGRISIMSSAPQYGRACMELGDPAGPVNTGHYGHGGGRMTRILAKYVGGCGAGRCYMAVQPDGDATPCVFMPIRLGNLRTDSFETVWNHPVMEVLRDRNDRTGHCRICSYKYHCGGCRARSWGYFRDLRRSDPGCKFNQAEWHAAQSQI